MSFSPADLAARGSLACSRQSPRLCDLEAKWPRVAAQRRQIGQFSLIFNQRFPIFFLASLRLSFKPFFHCFSLFSFFSFVKNLLFNESLKKTVCLVLLSLGNFFFPIAKSLLSKTVGPSFLHINEERVTLAL